MTYEIKTRVFEGPLDLLLQLISAHEVEITELSLSDIVAEYLTFLDLMKELDLDVTSEFLLIASTLIQLKARRLLPDDHPIDLDDELALGEERDRLLARLLMNLTFKDVAAVLAHRMSSIERYVGRDVGLDPDVVPPPPQLHLSVDAAGLAAVAMTVFADAGRDVDVDHLDLELPSVQTAMLDLQDRMVSAIESDFEHLVSHCRRSADVVAYFLGLLELSRWGILRVNQEDAMSPIVVTYNPDAAEEGFAAVVRGEEPS